MASAPKNRIVGHEVIDSKDLQANPLNWRRHPKRQKKVLKALLEQIGIVDEALVNRRTGRLIDGHLRKEITDKMPATIVDLSEAEERLALLILDPLSVCDSDQDVHAFLLDSLGEQSGVIADFLESTREKEPGEIPEPAEERYKEQFGVIVICEDQADQEETLRRLQARYPDAKKVTV